MRTRCCGTNAPPRAEPGLRSLEVMAKPSRVRCDRCGDAAPAWQRSGQHGVQAVGLRVGTQRGCGSWKHSAESAAWLLVRLQELALSHSRVLALSNACVSIFSSSPESPEGNTFDCLVFASGSEQECEEIIKRIGKGTFYFFRYNYSKMWSTKNCYSMPPHARSNNCFC